MCLYFKFSCYLLLILSYTSLPAFSEELTKLLDYPTIKVPSGNFDLYIPIPYPTGFKHIRKPVTFESGFEIGKYEVSNKLWNECFKRGGCSREAETLEGEKENHPAVRVNWHDVVQFTKWFSNATGNKYRLPTEEEWVYAVYMGKSHKEVVEEYDYSDLTKIRKVVKLTEPLGTYKENEWGLADFTGNVWEWTLTCWYGSEENILAKRSLEELSDTKTCSTRIALGENRSHIPDFIKDTYNGGCASLRPAANLGFRLIKEGS
ncbi:MAG: SUMF1/EgtB/PvdO family nonheme iron enzyme [Bdellovibrionota bacterium]